MDQSDLEKAFSAFGTVVSSKIITDSETGRSRGFGFIEFENEESATKARDEMNGKELQERQIKIDFAKERQR